MRLVVIVCLLSSVSVGVMGCSERVTDDADAARPPDAATASDALASPDAPVVIDAPLADAPEFLDSWAPDAFTPPDAFACLIGGMCNDANPCPEGWRCYGWGEDGFCAPFAPECGGFVMTRCDPGLSCLRAGGSSLGYCASAMERSCICEAATRRGFSVDGC